MGFAGRRGTMIAGLTVGGACCLLCVFATTGSVLLLVLVFTGKCGVALSFAIVYLYAAELFPTDIRSSSIGIQSLVARIGGMLAPIVADIGKSSQLLALVIFGSPCLLAGILLLGLPETRGQPMLNTIEDIPPPGNQACLPCFRRYHELDEESPS